MRGIGSVQISYLQLRNQLKRGRINDAYAILLRDKDKSYIGKPIRDAAWKNRGVVIGLLGTLRRRRPHDGNRKREISLQSSLRMYNTL